MEQKMIDDLGVTLPQDRKSKPFLTGGKSAMVDRRRAFRLGTNALAFIYNHNKKTTGFLKNISEHGACLLVEDAEENNWNDSFLSAPLVDSKNINFSVQWLKKIPENGHSLYGIKFNNLNKQESFVLRKRFLLDESLLLAHVEKLVKKASAETTKKDIKLFFLVEVKNALEALLDAIEKNNGSRDGNFTDISSRDILERLCVILNSLLPGSQEEGLRENVRHSLKELLGNLFFTLPDAVDVLEKPLVRPSDARVFDIFFKDIDRDFEEYKSVSWEEHYTKYCNPQLATDILRKAVPLLEFVDWRCIEIKEGFCRSVVPFNTTRAKNQNISHQASLFLLAADYTGGTALESLFRGLPSFGIHPEEYIEDKGIFAWLVKSDIKFIKASTSDLVVTAAVPEHEIEPIANHFFSKKRIIKPIEVVFQNGDEVVGRGTMKYIVKMIRLRDWLQMRKEKFSLH